MEEDIFTTYHPLILGALKKCHIYHHHPDFDDYIQAARIELLLLHREYDDKKHLNQPPFAPYAYQKIYWRTLDLVRKETKRLDNHPLDDLILDVYEDTKEDTCLHKFVETSDTYTLLCQELTPFETKVLEDRLFKQLSVTQLSKKYDLSRQTIYRVMERIQKKYRKIEKNL